MANLTYAYLRISTKHQDIGRQLGNMKISDWNEILQNKTQLQHYGELLDKHSRYVLDWSF